MPRPTRSIRTVLCLAAAFAVAPALAQQADVRPAAGPAEVLRAGLNLLPGDEAHFAVMAAPPVEFREIPGRQEFSGHVIVRPRADRGSGRVAPAVVQRDQFVREYVVAVPPGMTESEFVAFLDATGDYDLVEPDWTVYPAQNVPNDPQFGSSWQHTRIQSALAWTISTGSSDIIVAVCDTGCDLNHPDLRDSYVPGYNAVNRVAQADGGAVNDINGHGTFVAGCAAAIGNNGIGVVGVGWNFSIMPIRVSNSTGGGASISTILNGARWAAANGAHVINASYSGGTASAIQVTARELKEEGSLLFWASGNDNARMADVSRPDYVIVGSTTSSDTRSNFSNFGPPLDVVAPGSQVRSTRRGGTYGNGSGTSYASPIAAGVGAMIFAVNPALTPTDVQDILYASADDLGAPGWDEFFGHGRVNTFNAVTMAQGYVPRLGVPFFEVFDTGAGLDPAIWIDIDGAVVDVPPADPGAGSGAMRLEGFAETAPFRAATVAGEAYSVRIDLLAPDAGGTLVVEYADAVGQWVTARELGLAGDGSFFREEFMVPAAAMTNNLALRLTVTEGDAWYVDSVRIGPFEGLSAPYFESFASGGFDPVRWASVTGATVEPAGAIGEMRMPAGAQAETTPVRLADLDPILFPYYVEVRQEGLGSGDALRIEYRNTNDAWRDLVLIDAASAADGLTLDSLLPILAFTNNFALRFTAEGQGDGAWFVTNIYVGEEPFTSTIDCPADLAPPFGVLDIFDVLEFLSLFEAGEPAADLAPPFGVLDIFDVLEFLSLFEQGCP